MFKPIRGLGGNIYFPSVLKNTHLVDDVDINFR